MTIEKNLRLFLVIHLSSPKSLLGFVSISIQDDVDIVEFKEESTDSCIPVSSIINITFTVHRF